MEKLFAGLPVRKLGRGQILIYEGDAIDNIYFLLSGYVKVSSILSNGSQRTIFIYTPGDAFPLSSFLSGAGTARYFYECLTEVEVKIMPQRQFQDLIRGDLELGEKLMAYTYELNQQFANRIEMLEAPSAYHKVASLLAFLAAKAGTAASSQTRLNIPLTSQNIGDMCGLSRETTSVQLQRLKKEGAVTGKRHLLLNSQELERILASQT